MCRVVDTFVPEQTVLVHVSGVSDPSAPLDASTDARRSAIDDKDRCGTVEQVRRLFASGYAGPVSIETTSEAARASRTLESDLRQSFELLEHSGAAS